MALAWIPTNEPIHHVVEQRLDNLPSSFQRASITAETEIDYPAVREMHQTSSVVVPAKEVVPDISMDLGLEVKEWEKIPPSLIWPEIMEYPEAVFRRRSKRHYMGSISRDNLLALADSLCIHDFPDSDNAYEQTVGLGFIVNKVDSFSPGFYLLKRLNRSMGLVSPHVSTSQMAQICLSQSWLAKAAVHFLFMTNLDLLDRTWGPRGYRYAIMTTGRWGERLYVASTAMGLGCCGVGAFYDMNAAKLVGLNGTSCLLYLVAVGTIK